MDCKKKGCCNVSYNTLPYKLHYLLFCGAKGGILPFLNVFLSAKLNLSATALATILVARSFLIVITKPTIGMIVDYFNKTKLVMIFLTAGEVIFYYILLIIPPIERESNVSQISLETNDAQIHGYFYATFQNEENIFTIFQDQTLFNNASQEYLKFNMRLQCAESIDINRTHCSLISNDLNRCLNVTIYNELWQNSPFFSLTQENIYFNCSFYDLYIDSTNIAKKGIQHNKSSVYFPYQKILSNEFFQENIGCFWLNEINNSSEIPHSEIDEYLKNENPLISRALRSKTTRSSVYGTYQYWLCALIWLLASSCSNAMYTLSDTACYECLQRTGEQYGRQRLWGAVSWGLASPTSGFINDYFSTNSKIPNYAPGFHIFGILSFLEFLNLLRLDTVKPPRSKSFFKDFKKIFESKEFDVFLTFVFMVGFFTSFIWYYLMIYVESIGGSRLLMGLLNTSQCFLGEIPLMFYSGWITKKLGHMQVLVVSFTVFALRFACYYLIYNPWWLLPVEAMHGITYGTFYTALTAFGKSSAVPGTEATTQSVLCATYEGLGVGVGSIVSGIYFDHFGYKSMFVIASISSFGCAVCLYLVSMIFKTKTKSVELTPQIKC